MAQHLHAGHQVRREQRGVRRPVADSPSQFAAVAQRVAEQDERVLALQHQQRPVVRDHVPQRHRHQRVRELPGHRPRRRAPPIRPASAVATANSSATSATTATRPQVLVSTCGTGEVCTNVNQRGAFDAPSYAVVPSITATVATRPGAGRSASSPASGERTTSTPSARRPNTLNRPNSADHTSNASPRSNQRDPNTNPASSCTAAYSVIASRSTGSVALSGATSSSQVNASSPTRGRPVPDARRQRHRALARVQPGQPQHPGVQVPQRVQPPPHRPEQHRQRHQPDPEQHEHHERHRVVRVVLAEQQRHQHVQRDRPRPARPAASGSPASPARSASQRGSGRPACAPSSRGSRHSTASSTNETTSATRGAGHRERERQREVLAAADPVREDRAARRGRPLTPPAPGAAAARGGGSRPRTAPAGRWSGRPSSARRP